jgi:hypothetical protein
MVDDLPDFLPAQGLPLRVRDDEARGGIAPEQKRIGVLLPAVR